MYGKRVTTVIPAVLFVLAAVVLPCPTEAQEGIPWPPLEIRTSTVPLGNLLRYDVLLTNLSDVDLVDVIVQAQLPAGTSFNRFEAIEYATTSFDGQNISFTVLKVPARKSVGPMSAYITLQDAAPETLKTKIYAQWRGQIPGSLVVPEMIFGAGLAGPPPPTELPSTVEVDVTTPKATVAAEGAAMPMMEETPTVATPASFVLWDLLNTLKQYEFVDLTHTFAPGIPCRPGFPDAEFRTLYAYDTDGFFAQEFIHVGQYGTHLDPPAHFHKGLRTVDQIDVKEMVAPLVVINVADKVAADPDYQLTVDDVKVWEAKYGAVPQGAFVAMRSDWSRRWPDPDAFQNKDETGQAHYPGWSVEALRYLYEERKIVANGHETLDTDAALAQKETGFAAETYVLGTDHYQIALMTNLDKVPEAGAIVFAVVPKPRAGSGFPARVFAIVP